MSEQATINYMIVDDHSLVREGVQSLLEDESDIQMIAESSTPEECLSILPTISPDVVIVDINITHPKSGIDLVKKVKAFDPNQKCMMLSMYDSEEYVLESISAGASGYLLKDVGKKEFVKALRTIHEGQVYFSGDISKFLLKNLNQQGTQNGFSTADSMEAYEKLKEMGITKRESQILQFVTEGLSNQDIADKLGKSVRTIESHRFNLMKKMGAKNYIQLTQKAKILGLIQ